MATPIASTVLKAFEVLDLLSQHGRLTVNECAEHLGIPRSTAYRLLATLRQAGAVEASPGGHFRMGVRMMAMAVNSPAHRRLGERCRPQLDALAANVQAEVALSAFTPAGVVVLYRSRDGASQDRCLIPPHASADGKLLAAYGCEEDLQELLAGSLERCTSNTICDPVTLRNELERIRRRGYAEDRSESDDGVYGLAVPVRAREMSSVLALSARTVPPVDRRRLRHLYVHLQRCVGDLEQDAPQLRAVANG